MWLFTSARFHAFQFNSIFLLFPLLSRYARNLWNYMEISSVWTEENNSTSTSNEKASFQLKWKRNKIHKTWKARRRKNERWMLMERKRIGVNSFWAQARRIERKKPEAKDEKWKLMCANKQSILYCEYIKRVYNGTTALTFRHNSHMRSRIFYDDDDDK